MMPLERWLANELKARHRARRSVPRASQRRGLIRPAAIARLLAEHASGRKNHAMRLWVLLILERWFAALRTAIRRFESMRTTLDRAHREFLRLGRPGDPHPHRGARNAGPRPSGHAGHAARGADRRCRRAAGIPCRAASTSARSGSPTAWRCAAGSRPDRAHIDVLNTHSSTDSWLCGARLRDAPRRAADRAHAARLDDDPQSPDDALALRAGRPRTSSRPARRCAASSRATTAFRSTA